MSSKTRFGVASLLAIIGCLLLALPASATYPGQTGPIIFVKRTADSELWRVNKDGSGLSLIADFRSTSPDQFAFIATPSVSQDGKKIALIYIQDGTNTLCGAASGRCSSIVVMNSDGSNRRAIYSTRSTILGLALSPDGHRLVTSLTHNGASIFLLDADGTNLVRVTMPSHGADVLPAWSPDGRRIVFMSTRFQSPSTTWSIWLVDATGANLRKLLAVGGNDLWPDWSPDGTKIVFVRTFGYPDYRIHTVNVDGTDEREIVANRRAAESPKWSPDTTEVVFSEFQGEDFGLVNRDGTNLRMVSGPAGSNLAWAPLSLVSH